MCKRSREKERKNPRKERRSQTNIANRSGSPHRLHLYKQHQRQRPSTDHTDHIIPSAYIQSTHIMYSTRPPSRPKPLPWSAPSHLAVFVRNLQLLHLHHHEDWPNVTVRTLSPSSHNQRQRVKAVEWALYHLCAIWDPDITQDVCCPPALSV